MLRSFPERVIRRSNHRSRSWSNPRWKHVLTNRERLCIILHIYMYIQYLLKIYTIFILLRYSQVSSDMLTQCHFNYMEESVPVALEELGSELNQDWRGYLKACTTALLKEACEKWVTTNHVTVTLKRKSFDLISFLHYNLEYKRDP